MKKFVVSFLITSALGLCTAVNVLAQTSGSQRPPEPRPSSVRPSSIERSVGKMWDRMTNQNDRSWQREQRQQRPSHGGGIRGLLPEAETELWSGSWQSQQCTEVGGAIGVGCASRASSGDLHLYIEKSASRVYGNGTLYLGEIKVPLTITHGSPLRLSGVGRIPEGDVTITNWNSKEDGCTMSGNFTLTFHPDDSAAGIIVVRVAMEKMQKEVPKIGSN
jgi:hypothetical protein